MRFTVLVLLCGLLICSCQNQNSVPKQKFKTIMLKSEGHVETQPDMASFYINLNCLEWTAKKSKECLVEKSNELQEQLLASGIDEKEILTTRVTLNKSYRWERNTRVFKGFASSTRVHVTIKNIDLLDDIYTELLDNSNLSLGGLNYSHSKIDSLKNEAYLNALNNSALLADKLLSKIPETKKEVLKIGNVEISSSLRNNDNFKNERKMNLIENTEIAEKSKTIAMSTGTVNVWATLFVEYNIE